MNKIKIIFIGLLSSLLVSINVTAADVTAKTNIEGVVIKKFICTAGSYYQGNIVNRTDQAISNVNIKSYDSDGDPIGSCSTRKSLGPKSGDSFLVSGCNCGDSIFYKIHVK
jgi:hypothetical protein